MRLAIFSSADMNRCGGIEVMLKCYAEVYKKFNINYTIFAPYANKELAKTSEMKIHALIPAFSSICLKSPKLTAPFLNAYISYLIKGKYDIVHVHSAYPMGSILADAIRKTGIKSVLHCHAVEIQSCKKIGYGARLDKSVDEAIKNTILNYDWHIAANENIRSEILDMGVKNEKISLIFNGALPDKFRAEKSELVKIRKEFGITENEIFLMSAGRNHPVKNYPLALDALALIKDKVKFKYLLAGKDTDQLLDQISSLDLTDNIILKENIDNNILAKVMMAADAYLLPSYIEGFPLTKSEALMAGLPIITTNTPGCIDAIADGVNGTISNINNDKEYADAILRAIKNKDTLIKMKTAARESGKNLSWENIVKQHMEIYSSLLNSANGKGEEQ